MTTNRTSQDTCLLCLQNRATATNSHIYSKFFTKSLFGDSRNKEGYQLSTENEEYAEPAFDTPKENYLMCPNCENKRLGSMETHIATHFYNRYRNPKFTDAFSIARRFNFVTQELDSIVCERLHIGMFNIFIYSLVWRASISNHPTFKEFKLLAEVTEVLRSTLDICLKGNDKDTMAYYDANKMNFTQFQLNVVTTEDPKEMANLVTQPMKTGSTAMLLYVNEFMIIFYLKNINSRYDRNSNSGDYPINIALTRKGKWVNTPV